MSTKIKLATLLGDYAHHQLVGAKKEAFLQVGFDLVMAQEWARLTEWLACFLPDPNIREALEAIPEA